MQVGKRYSLWRTILWSKKYILIFLIIDSIPVIAYEIFDLKWVMIPWQPISLVGIAVSFYLGFKNNSSYERLWEARKIWGGIVNASRSLTIMTRDFVGNEFTQKKRTPEELKSIHKTIVHRHIAWLKALTYQLREKREWEHHSQKVHEKLRKIGGIHSDENHFEKLTDYLSDADYQYILTKTNKAAHLVSLQSKNLLKLKSEGLIDDFRHMELEKMLAELYSLQGKSERIKNYPLPRQYASANYFFVWIFISMIPLGMIHIFSTVAHQGFIWLMIPFSMLVSWVFIIMELVGEFSENPFEGLYNDIPITSMTRGIEIDVLEMLDETDIPEPILPFGDLKILL